MMYTDVIAAISTITLSSVIEELRVLTDSLVQTSLSQYVAYGLKESEAIAFLSNPKDKGPCLPKEAELRGISTEELANLVTAKASKMRDIVRQVELLRIELVTKFDEAPDKLAFRDDILSRARSLM